MTVHTPCVSMCVWIVYICVCLHLSVLVCCAVCVCVCGRTDDGKEGPEDLQDGDDEETVEEQKCRVHAVQPIRGHRGGGA